jgi:hypothetical protein
MRKGEATSTLTYRCMLIISISRDDLAHVKLAVTIQESTELLSGDGRVENG